jgi:hypothetical protein
MNHLTTTIDKASVTAFCADAISELERAARLHPKWPINLHYHDEDHENDNLKIARAINDHGRATGSTVFVEEFLEFMQAARKSGNQIAARAELVQAMAMLLRIGCHLNDYVSKEVQS